MTSTISVYEAVSGVGVVEVGKFKDLLAAKIFCLSLHKQGRKTAVNVPDKGLMWPDANPLYFEEN